MCAGAIQQARVARLVYGAPDQKVGAAGTVMNPLQNPRLLHRVEVQGGVLATDALGAVTEVLRRSALGVGEACSSGAWVRRTPVTIARWTELEEDQLEFQ